MVAPRVLDLSAPVVWTMHLPTVPGAGTTTAGKGGLLALWDSLQLSAEDMRGSQEHRDENSKPPFTARVEWMKGWGKVVVIQKNQKWGPLQSKGSTSHKILARAQVPHL